MLYHTQGYQTTIPTYGGVAGGAGEAGGVVGPLVDQHGAILDRLLAGRAGVQGHCLVYGTIPYGTIPYRMVRYGMVWYGMVQ